MSKNSHLAVTLALACAALPAAAAPRVQHAVIIVVDGLRPDAIEAAGATHIRQLAAGGARSDSARVVEMPETLPSLVTLVTGLAPSAHGVTWNDDDRGRESQGPTLFTRVSAAGLRTGLYFGKSKLAILAPRNSADVSFGPTARAGHRARGDGRIDAVAGRFAADFPRERFALALVHLREPDDAGHEHGWMSAPYLAAVRAADAAVGTVLRAIADSGLGGATAVLLTADHGGEGDNHGTGRGETSWRVPLICTVPGARPRAIAGEVTLADVAPTVLALLRLPPLPHAGGKPIPECL